MKKLFLFLSLLSFSCGSYAQGNSQSIGTYNNGCILNPVELKQGANFEKPRLSRRNNFANPEMIKFIEDLSGDVNKKYGKKLLVADISKNKGGRIPSLHASHQIGLDADIWYKLYDPKQNLNESNIETLSPTDMVSSDGKKISEYWSADNENILRMAARNNNVDRIFVNAAIKKQFCSKYKDEIWQRKIRAWWGHNEHFHVRLKCPANSPECVMTVGAVNVDGCDSSLNWWFSDEALHPQAKKEAPISEKEIFSRLPKRCQEILKDEKK